MALLPRFAFKTLFLIRICPESYGSETIEFSTMD